MSSPLSYTGSAYKALVLLKAMAEGDTEEGVNVLASRVGLPPSTTHRILKLLVETGFAETRDGRYVLGPEIYYISYLIQEKNPLLKQGMKVIQKAAAESGETVALAQYTQTRHTLTFIASIDSIHPIRHVITLGKNEPLYLGAPGKAILAYLPSDIEEKIINESSGAKNASGIPIDFSKLREELEKIRQRGYAISKSERIIGAVGFGAPIIGPQNKMFGAVGITVPESRFNATGKEYGTLARSSADEISRALGVQK